MTGGVRLGGYFFARKLSDLAGTVAKRPEAPERPNQAPSGAPMGKLATVEVIMGDVAMVAESDVDVEVHEATPDEGRTLLDHAAQRWLGISGDEFLERWHAGKYADDENPDLPKVALLIPFAE